MLIEIKAQDENGITTILSIDEDITDVEGLQEVFKKFTLFMLKNGAELPDEIIDHLYE
tara:strand:- start:1349 stop:1522 length:174 start_codon:yes stop_codon:yes gene_type:complete